MIKTILVSTGTLSIMAAPTAVAIAHDTSTTATSESNENHTIFFDGRYFSSKNELLRYYILEHPEAISNKTVLGDVSHSIIDIDDGILNPNTLYDYDINRINPVYYKSSGQATPSYEDALASYANRVFIRKKYQGVKNIFSNIEDARAERKKLTSNLYMDYYDAPKPTGIPGRIKLNPLNKDDMNDFKDQFMEAFNKDNFPVNDSYVRKFDIPQQNQESLLKNSEYDHFSNITSDESQAVELSFGDFIKDNHEDFVDSDFILNTDYKNNTISEESMSNINIKFFGSDGISFETKLSSSYHDNGLKSGWFDEPTWFTGSSFGKKSWDKEKKMEHNNKLISSFFDENSLTPSVKVTSSNNGNWNFNLSSSKAWNQFAKQVKFQQKTIADKWGLNYNIVLSAKIKKVHKYKKGKKFPGINAAWYDEPDTTGGDKMAIRNIDLKYFNFKVKFLPEENPESFLSHINNKLRFYVSDISLKDINQTNWKKDLADLFKELVDEEQETLRQKSSKYTLEGLKGEMELLKNIKGSSTVLNNIQKIAEHIDINNIQRTDTNKIFKVIRNSGQDKNIELQYNPVFEKSFNKEAVISDIITNTKNLDDSAINTSEKNAIKKILDFLLAKYNRNNITEDLANALNIFGEKELNIDPAVMDDSISIHNFEGILRTHLHSLNLYLNKASLRTIGDYSRSILLKNMCVDLSNTFYAGDNYFHAIKGTYVLVNESLFNAGVYKDSAGRIGTNNIFSGSTARSDIANYRDIVIHADPPAIRVMYNINGEAILGDTTGGSDPIYDKEDIMVVEARNQADVRKSEDYIFYRTSQGLDIQILNMQSNIYTLTFEGRIRYFMDYNHLKNYLINRLMNKAILIA